MWLSVATKNQQDALLGIREIPRDYFPALWE